jgi:putative ABC transport system substrate-binding protein
VIDRRKFVTAVAGALLTLPRAIEAQQAGKVPRVGYLQQNSAEASPHLLVAFRQALGERGWVEGQNVLIEVRNADGKVDRLPALVAELIRLNVDVIVAGSSRATWAARDATKSIPIVMAASADALGEGLVTSLAHPGGNITGMTFLAGPEIAGKQLQLLKEVAPAASRIAVLTNPTNRSHAGFANQLKLTARSLGAQLQVLEAQDRDQIDSAFVAMPRERATAFLVLTDSLFLGERRRIVDLAARSGLPALYSQREFAADGGLVSYGPSLSEMFRGAATHVDKILRGARPGDIPVEQPTKFELVINLKTAKALGLKIPQSLLQRADEVIE